MHNANFAMHNPATGDDPPGAAPDVSACPTTEVPFALPDTVLIATLMNAGKLAASPRQLLRILATCSEHGVAVEINATPGALT